MKVVADASILIHLASIGRFYLLKKLFKEIIIPEGVYTEVVIEGWGYYGSLETSEAIKENYITVKKVTDKEIIKALAEKYKVSISNAEVVQIAKELNADIVLANEEEVRSAIEEAGLQIKGCLGIIINAVKEEEITVLQAIKDIDNLVSSGYRINEDIVNKAKKILKELGK